jgi:hypothetical protein
MSTGSSQASGAAVDDEVLPGALEGMGRRVVGGGRHSRDRNGRSSAVAQGFRLSSADVDLKTPNWGERIRTSNLGMSAVAPRVGGRAQRHHLSADRFRGQPMVNGTCESSLLWARLAFPGGRPGRRSLSRTRFGSWARPRYLMHATLECPRWPGGGHDSLAGASHRLVSQARWNAADGVPSTVVGSNRSATWALE